MNFTMLFMATLEKKLEEAKKTSDAPINLVEFMPTVWDAMRQDSRYNQEDFGRRMDDLSNLNSEEYPDLLYRLVEKVPVQTPEQCQFFMGDFLREGTPIAQQFLQPHTSGKFALHFAASHGKILLIKAMVAKLVAIKEDSFPKGTLKTITELQNFYDLPDVRMIDSKPHKKGGTVLHYVALSTHLSVAEKLKLLAELIWDCKANPDAKINDKYTFATILDHLIGKIEGKAEIQQFAKFVEAMKPVVESMKIVIENIKNNIRVDENLDANTAADQLQKNITAAIKKFKKSPWLSQLFFDYPPHQEQSDNERQERVRVQYLLLQNSEFSQHLSVLLYNQFAHNVYQLMGGANWDNPDSNPELRDYVNFLKRLFEQAQISSVCMVLAKNSQVIEEKPEDERDYYERALTAAERECAEYREKLAALAKSSGWFSTKSGILEDAASLQSGLNVSLRAKAFVLYMLSSNETVLLGNRILHMAQLVTIHRENIEPRRVKKIEDRLAENDGEIILSESFKTGISNILFKPGEPFSPAALEYARYYYVKTHSSTTDKGTKDLVISVAISLLKIPAEESSLSREAYADLEVIYKTLTQQDPNNVITALITTAYVGQYNAWQKNEKEEPKPSDCTPGTIALLKQVLMQTSAQVTDDMLAVSVQFLFQYYCQHAHTNPEQLATSLQDVRDILKHFNTERSTLPRIKFYYGMILAYQGQAEEALKLLAVEERVVDEKLQEGANSSDETQQAQRESQQKYLNKIRACKAYAQLQHAQGLLGSGQLIGADEQINRIISGYPSLASWMDPVKNPHSAKSAKDIKEALLFFGFEDAEAYKEFVYRNQDARTSAWSHNMLGQLYESLGDYVQAVKEYQIAAGLRKINDAVLQEPCIEGLYHAARHHESGTGLEKKEPQLAVSLYWRAYQMNPPHPLAQDAFRAIKRVAGVVIKPGKFFGRHPVDAPETALAKIVQVVVDMKEYWFSETVNDDLFADKVIYLEDWQNSYAFEALQALLNQPSFNKSLIEDFAIAIIAETDAQHLFGALPEMIQYALLHLHKSQKNEKTLKTARIAIEDRHPSAKERLAEARRQAESDQVIEEGVPPGGAPQEEGDDYSNRLRESVMLPSSAATGSGAGNEGGNGQGVVSDTKAALMAALTEGANQSGIGNLFGEENNIASGSAQAAGVFGVFSGEEGGPAEGPETPAGQYLSAESSEDEEGKEKGKEKEEEKETDSEINFEF